MFNCTLVAMAPLLSKLCRGPSKKLEKKQRQQYKIRRLTEGFGLQSHCLIASNLLSNLRSEVGGVVFPSWAAGAASSLLCFLISPCREGGPLITDDSAAPRRSRARYCSVTAVSPFTPPSTRCDCSFIQVNCFSSSSRESETTKDGRKKKTEKNKRNSNLLLDTVRNGKKRIKETNVTTRGEQQQVEKEEEEKKTRFELRRR